MSALAKNETAQHENTVTTINANARIDYILRFSKQVALVLDDVNEGYGEVASQFLSALPDNHNAAYIAISPKLNDIQVRCRIIEQLFIGVPFDPEQPLATSIIELAQQQNTPISIVAEHCHHMSLQILHELCQLVEVAKKSKREINIVITGQLPLGKLVATNPILFTNKVSMVSADTGQLISPKADIFKEEQAKFSLAGYKRMLAIFSVLLLIGGGTVYSLYQFDNMSFSGIDASKTLATTERPASFIALNSTSSKSAAISEGNTPKKALPVNDESGISANNKDIFNAIINNVPKEQVDKLEMASPEEIAIELTLTIADYPFALEQTVQEGFVMVDEQQLIANEPSNVDMAPSPSAPVSYDDYFASLDFGYVLQFVTLSYDDTKQIPSLVTQYTSQHEDVIFKHYRRIINGKAVVVITSDFFTDKASATAELESLPSSLASSGAWIKTVSAIKEDIAQFKSSQ